MQTEEKRKKVLFLITKSNFGGAQKYVYELTNALKNTPLFEVVVAFGGEGLLAEKLRESGVRIHILKTLENNISFLQVFSNLREIIALLNDERPDILHLNSSKAGLFGAFCGRFFSNSKIIFTSHGWPHNEDRPWIVRLFLKLLMGETILLCHKSIAVSKKIEEETPFYFLAKNKIEQIYFGIPKYEFLDRDMAREKLHIESVGGRLEIVTTAELHLNKGYQYALMALRNLVHNDKAHIHYHILGGEGGQEEKIKRWIQKYNLELDVTMHGFVKDAGMYMKAFDIFLLTSITEALGYVVLEAGYAGLPVVATAVGGIPEVIKHGETGLLAKSRDAKDIRDKLYTMIHEKELREKLAKQLHESVLDKFTLDVTIQKTVALYKSLL
jgi:glycosyltransferase involved in cell wall biosynthesis